MLVEAKDDSIGNLRDDVDGYEELDKDFGDNEH